MSTGDPMDEQVRRFLDWQAGQLDGSPDAQTMAVRVARRTGARSPAVPSIHLGWLIVVVLLVAAAAAGLIGSGAISPRDIPSPLSVVPPAEPSSASTPEPTGTASKTEPPSSTAASTTKPSNAADLPDIAPGFGLLDPGTYTYGGDVTGGTQFNVRFTVPAGWTWHGRYLSKGGVGLPDGAAIFFFEDPVQVYADPCHWFASVSPVTRPAGLDIATFMADLAAQPLRAATTPIDRPASGLHITAAPGSTNPPGSLFGASGPQPWSGMSVELSVPNDIDFATCDEGQFRSWGPEADVRSHQGPGQHDLVWAVDLVGNGVNTYSSQTLIVDAASFPGTPPDVLAEIDAILESIVVGHWG